jgi:hypothetical protein
MAFNYCIELLAFAFGIRLQPFPQMFVARLREQLISTQLFPHIRTADQYFVKRHHKKWLATTLREK